MTHIDIRPERPADYRESEALMRDAFWNRYEPGCSEHYLLHIMRSSPRYVPCLAFVAETEGRIVGAVAVLASHIEADDGRRLDTLSLGPIGVSPTLWGRGIGRALLDRVRREAAAAGHRAILLCGDPAFYSRAGYVPAERFGIRTADNFYFDALQVCPLRPGALDGAAGRYVEDPVYNVDPQLVEAFDRAFPPRERLADTPSQRRFQEMCARMRPGPAGGTIRPGATDAADR